MSAVRTEEIRAYLEAIADNPAGGLIDIRYTIARDGMAMRFVSASQLDTAVRVIASLAKRTDTYTGVLLREQRSGTRQAVASSRLLFVEIDSPNARQRLERFEHEPTLVIASGSPGHLHAYWRLRHPVDADELEAANRKLAYHLDGDLASVDAARILRPAGTLNYKHTPPAAVQLISLKRQRRYDLSELVATLPAPPSKPAPPTASRQPDRSGLDGQLLAIPGKQYVRQLAGLKATRADKVRCPFHELSVGPAGSDGVSPGRSLEDASLNDRAARSELSASSGRVGASSDPLRLVPPPVYFERLTGLRVGRSGKLRCLFHDDRVPSLHVYREPERGWYCFGCGRGGSIYDLAALLSGRSTRGSDFRELRRELESLFL